MQSKIARIFLGRISQAIRALSFLASLLGVFLLFFLYLYSDMRSSTVFTITNLSVFGVAFLVAGIIVELVYGVLYMAVVFIAWVKRKVLSEPGKLVTWNLLSFALTIILCTFTLVAVLNSNLPSRVIASNDIWWSFQADPSDPTHAARDGNGQFLFSDFLTYFRQQDPNITIPFFYTYHPDGSHFLTPYTYVIYFAFAVLLLLVFVAITYATMVYNARFVRTEPWLVDWFYEHYDARKGKKPPKAWEPFSGNVLLAPENLYEMNRVCPKCNGGLRRISGLNSNNVYVQCMNFPKCAYILNWADYMKFIKFSGDAKGGSRLPADAKATPTTTLVKSLADTKTVAIGGAPKRFKSPQA